MVEAAVAMPPAGIVRPSHSSAHSPTSVTYGSAWEKASLILIAVGSATNWATGFLLRIAGMDEYVPLWIWERSVLFAALPAIVLGAAACRHYANFVRSICLLACVTIFALGIMWADPTERGRGIITFAFLAIPLPVAALIVKNRYFESCMLAFVVASTCTFAVGLLQPGAAANGRFGVMLDEYGTSQANPNAVGLQAALVALLVYELYFAASSGRSRMNRASHRDVRLGFLLFGFSLAVVALSGSRTAMISVVAGLMGPFVRDVRVRIVLLALPLCLLFYLMATESLGLFDVLMSRFQDRTLQSAGDRTDIWSFSYQVLTRDFETAVLGVGSGALDKELGAYTFEGVGRGRDDVFRLHSHNLYIEWVVTLGALGAIPGALLLLSAVGSAFRLDRLHGSVFRRSLLSYCLVLGLAAVVYRAEFWPVVGGILWASLSDDLRGIQ